MLSVKINVESAAATASLDALNAGLKDRTGLHASMASGVELALKNHLERKYVPRNKRGDFWKRVHDSIETTSDEGGAEVAMVEIGIALRYEGGNVTPGKNPARSGPNKGKPTRALAVPSDAVPVVSGRQLTPEKMGLLAFLRAKTPGDTVGYLVEGQGKVITRGPNKGNTRVVPKPGGSLLFTLRSITRHKGDPGILPSDAEIINAATAGALEFLDSFEA